MEDKKLDLSIKENAKASINKTLMSAVLVLNVVLASAYFMEVVKGARDIVSYLIIAFLCLSPYFVSSFIYRKNKSSNAIHYYLSIGFALLYGYLMLSTESELVFCYIIVFFVILLSCSDFKLMASLGVYSIVVNVIVIIRDAVTVGLSAADITNAEIVIACLALTTVFAIFSVKKIESINQANIDKADEGKRQSEELLKTTLQVAASMTDNIDMAFTETDSLKAAIAATQQEMSVLAKDTDEASEAIENQRESTDRINEYIQGVEDAVHSIVAEVSNAEENLNAGNEVMKELLHQVQMSENSGTLVTKEMQTLKEYADKMQSIMTLIQNVAGQTGMLALNASIEAARAGEAGRGFAVVATEISNLSSQTKVAADDISELIMDVVKSVEGVNSSMEDLLESNRVQNGLVEGTAKNIGQIHDSTVEISKQVAQLKDTVDVVTEANHQVVESIENVSDVMKRVSAGAGETLESCNTNLQSIDKVADAMDNLKEEAKKLTSE